MLHLRYDWRRPLFWVAVCLVFFLSSQGGYNNKADEKENVAEKQKSSIGNREWATIGNGE